MNISIVIIAFKSEHVLDKLIESIPSTYEILVIENSLNNEIKSNLEKKFSNLKVFIPKENLGYSAGVNLGIQNSTNNFVFILTPDVIIKKNVLQSFEKLLETFDSFSLLAPVYENTSVHKNFKIFQKGDTEQLIINSFKLKEVDEIDGACFLINKREFQHYNIMDENFFLYFDSTDLCHKLKKENKKMYIVSNLTFNHEGTASSKEEFKFEILLNRNWHYSWSKFYFYKKNVNYLHALKKVSPNLLKALINFFYFKIIFDNKKASLNKAILSGIFNSILLRKSSYRPKIK